MNVLDDKFITEKSLIDKSVKSISLKYGIVGTLIIVVLSILSTIVFETGDRSQFWIYNWVFKFFTYLTYIVIMIFAIFSYKKTNQNYISYKKAFVVSYLPGCIMAVCDMITSIALIYIVGIKIDHAKESVGTVLENWPQFLIYLMGGFTMLFVGLIVGAFLSSIVSLIMKKEKPKGFNVI